MVYCHMVKCLFVQHIKTNGSSMKRGKRPLYLGDFRCVSLQVCFLLKSTTDVKLLSQSQILLFSYAYDHAVHVNCYSQQSCQFTCRHYMQTKCCICRRKGRSIFGRENITSFVNLVNKLHNLIFQQNLQVEFDLCLRLSHRKVGTTKELPRNATAHLLIFISISGNFALHCGR